ncbi:PTS sugar transporter subunit IIA [Vagococcus salmoninarum]|uniref:Mannitol-specific phosphotransferase enzyme IIA component n=1 Tax=Vagococcus salmoninarum TaxID=2739 RepID=A0A429ZUR3_9ENTE|nr:PTS sugar transporter subunit IIA [Vagococcus salmoninarum]MBE9388121.1 PTS sugar transporter subunit IIA [Vagococcus salmoninarum]RST97417.1 PTS mannitol transporter subunit IIA [Vagococcus salmoninarum]
MKNLQARDIQIKQHFPDKISAIHGTGHLLAENGYTELDYIEEMIKRDQLTSTYIGNLVAIPHGTDDSQPLIKASGIVITQVPEGVDFDGNLVKVIIGIAGIGEEHLELLSTIAIVCSDLANVEAIVQAETPEAIIEIFKENGDDHE